MHRDCGVAGLARCTDGPAVRFRNEPAYGKSHPHAFRFGAEEGREDVFELGWGDAFPVVRYGDDDLADAIPVG